MGAKIAWLDANFARRDEVATWHQPVSFMVEALIGARRIAHSLASTTMLYDMRRRAWDDELVARFGARPSELPELAAETERAGGLSHAGAELTGLRAGLPVAVGTGDDFSSLLGSGIVEPGTVAVSLGTAETVGALSHSAVIDTDALLETHVFPGGGFHLGNPGWLSGGAVRWAMTLLSIPDDEHFSALAAQAPAGCDGLIFVPALTGAMSPKWISAARGSFVGLTPGHGPAHAARSVLEGTAFAMRDSVDRLETLGVPTARLRLMGGGARSSLWCRIRADLTGRPADVLAEADASATGAALIA
jgi:xylulokinase